MVGDLLIALRKAGAVTISPPVCAECGKLLRTFQRRGEGWYCGVCGPVREPCAACGNTRRVSCRDREGEPRCSQCPPDDGGDPVEIIVDVVTGIDPTLSADVVATAVHAAVPQAGQCHQLAWALQDRPELLIGAGAEAPVPSVLRLIDKLCAAGSTGLVRPPCPHCGRVITLVKPRDGLRLCRNCVAKSRAERCSRCGTVREAATRDDQGRPLCPYCLTMDPANQEICLHCDRRRPVSVRTPEGPLCPACRPVKTMTCSICGRHARCFISKTTGQPWCEACGQRWARCTGCGELRPVRGGTLTEPLCATCTRPDPGFWRSCTHCGQPGRIHNGRCARCTVQQRLRELLGDNDGEIRPELQALYHSLATTDRPSTVAAWLDKSAAPTILRGLEAGKQITHQVLDDLPASKPTEHLRSVLVAIGTLPPRDEQMTRLERWITRTIAGRTDPDEQQLLHRYAVWHLLRRLRRRTEATETTHNQLVAVRQHVRGATALLDWLTAHNLTLATCRQGDLDRWLTDETATHCREAGHFVRWAKKQKLTRLDFPAVKWGGPRRVIDTEARWEQARWLLHDDTLKPEDRVAGLVSCSMPNGRPQSAASLSTTSRPMTKKYDCAWVTSPSHFPNHWPASCANSSPPVAATPPSATKERRHGCSPAGNPADPSAHSSSPNDSANSGCTPDKPARPRCSNSPPNCLPRCWHECSASTSPLPSHGNAPAAATGPTTPPKSAAGRTNEHRHSDSSDTRCRQRRSSKPT